MDDRKWRAPASSLRTKFRPLKEIARRKNALRLLVLRGGQWEPDAKPIVKYVEDNLFGDDVD
jgi:hypothetical protein